MNQKYVYLKKTFKKEKLDVYGSRRHNSTSCSVVCIFCGYNSKRVATNFCPMCKETLISYHTSIKIPKFKSKNWNKFVNYILAEELRIKFQNYFVLRNNYPTKNKNKSMFAILDDIPDLKYYDVGYCLANNICPNLDFMVKRDKQFIKKTLQKENKVLY